MDQKLAKTVVALLGALAIAVGPTHLDAHGSSSTCLLPVPVILPIAVTKTYDSGSWSSPCSSGKWTASRAGGTFSGRDARGSAFYGSWDNYSFGGGNWRLIGPGLYETYSGSWDNYSFGGGSFLWSGPGLYDSVSGSFDTYSFGGGSWSFSGPSLYDSGTGSWDDSLFGGSWSVSGPGLYDSDAGHWTYGASTLPTPGVTPAPVVTPAPTLPPVSAGPRLLPGWHSKWVSQSDYPTMAPGEVRDFWIRFQNAGTESWTRGTWGRQANLALNGDNKEPFRLGMAVNWLWDDRIATSTAAIVEPGQVGEFRFSVRAPLAPGLYSLNLRPVIDGNTWMEDEGVFWNIAVRAAAAAPTPTPTPTPSAVRSGAVLTSFAVTVNAGAGIGLSWSGISNPTPKDWIALALPSSPNSVFAVGLYVPADLSTSGTFNVPATVPPGVYEFRYFYNDGYQRLATSSPVTVLGPSSAAPQQPASVQFISLTTPISPGYTATVAVKTSPSAYCTIVVTYLSGPSTAAGLYPKTSDGSGAVSWSWIVGARTTPGSWPIDVSCGSASGRTYLQVY